MQKIFGAGVEAKLRAARARHDEKNAALDRSKTILERLPADRDAIALRAGAGELTDAQVEKALDELGDTERRQADLVAHTVRTIAMIEREIAELQRAGELETFGELAERAAETRKAAVAASTGFDKQQRTMIGLAAKLEQARQVADAAAVAAEQAHPDGPSGADLPLADEPTWPTKRELDPLIALMRSGPRQPIASGAAASEQAAKARERQDNELVNQCVNGLGGLLRPDMIAAEIGRLPERLQPVAWERARAKNDDARRVSDERKAAEQAKRPQRVLR